MGDINVKMRLDGEREWSAAIKNATSELKNMKSALQLYDETAKGSANTLQTLTERENKLKEIQKSAENQLKTLQDVLEKCTEQRDEAKKKLDELTKSETASASEVEAAQKAYDKASERTNYYADKVNKAAIEVEKADANLKKNQQYLDEASKSADGCATSIDEYGKKVNKAGQENEDFQKTLEMGTAMEAVKTLAEQVGEAFKKLGEEAYAAARELDDGYDTIITKTGASGSALESLTASADELFGQMPATMSTIGSAIGEVNTRFGLMDEALEDLSKQFIQFAEINGVDVSNSIDQTDRILTQFGEDAENAADFLGMLTKRSQETGIATSKLLSTLDTNAGVLTMFDLSLEESVNLMAKFEDNGIDSSTALAGMKRAAAEYAKEGKSMREGLVDTIDAIKNASTETEAYSKAQEIFGTRGFTNMADAIRSGRFNLEDLCDSLENYGSVVSDTYEATLDPWDQMTVAANNLKTVASDLAGEALSTLTPALEGLSDILKDVRDGFNELPEPVQNVIGVVAGIGVAAGTVAPKIVSFVTTVKTLKAAQAALDFLKGTDAAASSTATALSKLTANIGPLSGLAGVAAGIAAVWGICRQIIKEAAGEEIDLANSTDDLKKSYDGAVKTLEGLNSGLYDGLSAEKKAAKAEEALATIQETRAEATVALAEAEEGLNANQIELNDTSFALADQYGVTTSSVSLLGEKVTALSEAQENANSILDDQSDAYSNAQAQVDLYNASTATLSETSAAARDSVIEEVGAISGNNDVYYNAAEAVNTLTEAHVNEQAAIQTEIDSIQAQMDELQASYDEAYQSALNSLESQFGLFQTMSVEVEQSVTDMIASLDSQISYMDTYAANMQRAAELGVSEGLLAQLSDGSVESAAILQAIVDDGGANVEELNAKFAKVSEGKEAFAKQLAETETNFSKSMASLQTQMDTAVKKMNKSDAAYQSAISTIQGYINGSEAKRGALIAEYTSLGNAAKAAYNAALDIHSPSKEAEWSSEMFVAGLIKGIKDSTKKLTDTYSSLGAIAMNAYKGNANLTNASRYNTSPSVYTDVTVNVGDKKLTEYMQSAVEKGISQNQRNAALAQGRR